MPLLLAGGAGALGHWACRGVGNGEGAFAPLHQAYRAYTLEAVVREGQLAAAARALHEAGVPALLGKGWAVAREYARAALRPYGDLDFYVSRADSDRALRALRALHPPLPVDLHPGFGDLADREGAALLARAREAALGGVPVLTFGREDHMRLVALHLLRHGATRCLWLCDIGALLESAPPSFDWELALAGPPRTARAVACVVGLAETLLGARLTEAARAALDPHGVARLPAWLADTVLAQWGEGSAFRLPVAEGSWKLGALTRSFVKRWPNGVEATFGLEGSFEDGPRWPLQAGFAGLRALRFARSLAGPR